MDEAFSAQGRVLLAVGPWAYPIAKIQVAAFPLDGQSVAAMVLHHTGSRRARVSTNETPPVAFAARFRDLGMAHRGWVRAHHSSSRAVCGVSGLVG